MCARGPAYVGTPVGPGSAVGETQNMYISRSICYYTLKPAFGFALLVYAVRPRPDRTPESRDSRDVEMPAHGPRATRDRPEAERRGTQRHVTPRFTICDIGMAQATR